MKTSLACLTLALAALAPVLSAHARTHEETRMIIENPRLIERADSPRMHVVFPHLAHKELGCRTCHHEMTPERRVYLSCADNAACHNGMDLADRSDKSYYLALHDTSADRSCLGCHAKKAVERPGLDTCTTCHQASLSTAK